MKILFAGVRWEACYALALQARARGFILDVATFRGTFIDKNSSTLATFARGVTMLERRKKPSLSALYELMAKENYDIFFSAGFPYILPKEFFGVPSIFINSHPHILPAHKGYNVIAESFARGESRYGVTVHRMTEKVDDGPVILLREVTIPSKDIEYIYRVLFSFVEPALITESFEKVLSLDRKAVSL